MVCLYKVACLKMRCVVSQLIPQTRTLSAVRGAQIYASFCWKIFKKKRKRNTVGAFSVEWPDVCSHWRPASGIILNWGVMKTVPYQLGDAHTHSPLCWSVYKAFFCTQPKHISPNFIKKKKWKTQLSPSWSGTCTNSVITGLMTFFYTHAGMTLYDTAGSVGFSAHPAGERCFL